MRRPSFIKKREEGILEEEKKGKDNEDDEENDEEDDEEDNEEDDNEDDDEEDKGDDDEEDKGDDEEKNSIQSLNSFEKIGDFIFNEYNEIYEKIKINYEDIINERLQYKDDIFSSIYNEGIFKKILLLDNLSNKDIEIFFKDYEKNTI